MNFNLRIIKMKKILYILIGLVLLSSCDDYLDVKPVGKLIPTKIEDYDRLLNNSSTYKAYDYVDDLELLGDNVEFSETIFPMMLEMDFLAEKAMTYKFDRPYKNPQLDDELWKGIYNAAFQYNNVIEGISDVLSQDPEYGHGIIAQAKAARALDYLNACLFYGPAYKPGAANDTKTIPYRTEASVTSANPELSTTDEVFKKVEEEFLEALEFIPEHSSNIRFNGITLKTAMAYYYMLKGDFANMLTYADAAWNDAIAAKGGVENLLYDFNKFQYQYTGGWHMPGTDPEANLNLIYDDGADVSFNESYAREILLYRNAPEMMFFAYASQEFISLFSEKDQRGRLFLLKYAIMPPDGIVNIYFRADKLSKGNTTGFSYPDLLLMRAEAYARNNQDADALADLNTLRKYRFESGSPVLTGLTGEALLNEILNERRREQPIPSHKRVIDLKRFAAYDAGKPWAKTVVTHDIMRYIPAENPLPPVPSGTSFSAPVDSEYFIYPISNNVLLYNPHWGIPLAPETYNPSL